MDFKIGDVVRLKSGGSPMTVEMIVGGLADIRTVWMVEGCALRGKFPAAALEPCEPDEETDEEIDK
jgi:uncharacterized protein YodC (DUF2158 family)